jgi:predicted  nucleic acid-binding Zn-ribbon protein
MPDLAPTCPNCGHGFAALRRSTRMFDCPSCGTTLFRENDALAPIGNHGEMHTTPMLFGLGDRVEAGGEVFEIVGHARFDYGRGVWDEMWGLDANGDGVWLSVDEGDVALQRAFAPGSGPRQPDPMPVGHDFIYQGRPYTVTEADTATCTAIRGEFPEKLEVGERYRFVNAAGREGALLSGEFWDGGHDWFEGVWLDPFTITVRPGA